MSTTGIQIYVRTFTGKTLTLSVGQHDKVRVVKTLIRNKEGIPHKLQRLCYEYNELDDCNTLHAYNIDEGSTLNLSIHYKTGMHILVKTSNTGNDVILLKVNPSDTIQNIKMKIQREMNFPIVRQFLFYQGKCLKDDCTLTDYSIPDCSVLHHQMYVGSQKWLPL